MKFPFARRGNYGQYGSLSSNQRQQQAESNELPDLSFSSSSSCEVASDRPLLSPQLIVGNRTRLTPLASRITVDEKDVRVRGGKKISEQMNSGKSAASPAPLWKRRLEESRKTKKPETPATVVTVKDLLRVAEKPEPPLPNNSPPPQKKKSPTENKSIKKMVKAINSSRPKRINSRVASNDRRKPEEISVASSSRLTSFLDGHHDGESTLWTGSMELSKYSFDDDTSFSSICSRRERRDRRKKREESLMEMIPGILYDCACVPDDFAL